MTDRHDRSELIEALEAKRGRRLISYVTSTRPGSAAPMALDAIPVIFDHLQRIVAEQEPPSLDLFLHTDGGSGIVPWRLVSLLREYSPHVALLVPHHAYSAGTLTALGADEVVMHPMAVLGPIDPTITTVFNPIDDLRRSHRQGISVEDLYAYLALVKEDVGITHEDELVQAFTSLTEKVHPLAIGSVKRSTQQSRLMGAKLMRSRQDEMTPHDVDEVIEKLTSKLYFHGHTINRREAREDLALEFVLDASPDVEPLMWNLYRSYADEMRLTEDYNPALEAIAVDATNLPDPPSFGKSGDEPPPAVRRVRLPDVTSVYVESRDMSDRRQQEVEVTLARDWAGGLSHTETLLSNRWRRRAG